MNNSPSEIAPIHEKASLAARPRRFIYRGPSMTPTFRPGQILNISPQCSEITPGDVIVFHNQEGKGHVVHRVIAITGNGFITRGDNNLFTDPSTVLPDQLIGKVELVELIDRVKPLLGGWRGLWQARFLRKRLLVKRLLRRGLGKPYWWLKCSGIVTKFWHPEIVTINFKTQDGPLVKYIHKGRTVASCWTDGNRWWFRRPYDFVLDPKAKVKGKS